MSSLPPELDFSTELGREATPDRMNQAMGYLLNLINGLQSARADFDAVVKQLQDTGYQRLTEALQPVFEQAEGMATTLAAAQAALDTADWRGQLIADVRDAVVAAIAADRLYVKAGPGAQDATLFAGSGAPDNSLGVDGDLYVQGG